MVKVCHITTVHPPFDPRIFYKECISLYKAGYDVYLITTYDTYETVQGIKIIPLPKEKNRIYRFLKKGKIALQKAIEVDADVYHFHDPELIPIGIRLKKLGKKVIYDVHEDVAEQIYSKEYIPKFSRFFISKVFDFYEKKSSKKFDLIITSTDYIANLFKKKKVNAVSIKNYVIAKNLKIASTISQAFNKFEPFTILFAGTIYKERGLIELIKAVNILKTSKDYNIKVLIYGKGEKKFIEDLLKIDKYRVIEYKGFIDWNTLVNKEIKKANVGFICDYPLKRNIVGLPVKLFEYMATGIPVIASNFPLWKEIVEGNKCGICVDPLNPHQIAKAIQFLIENPYKAIEMGKNGRKAVLEKYSWEQEEKKLVNIYRKLTKNI